MESTVHKIFSDRIDEQVHGEFVKFGKGVFENKYIIEGKKQKEGWTIKTSAEFANYLVKKCLDKTFGDIDIKGVIVSTFNIQDKANFPIERVKQFMGIKQAVVNTRTSPTNIINMIDEYPKAFYALSFMTKDYQLKIKAKAPKSAKPSSNGEKEASADFCSLKTKDREIVNDLFFDNPNFKEIKIKNTLIIKEIILPASVADPVQLREKAIRKGKIIRVAYIDGVEKRIEKEIEI